MPFIMVLLYGENMLLNSFPACLACPQGWVLVLLAEHRLDHHYECPLKAGVDMVSNYCLPSTTARAKTFMMDEIWPGKLKTMVTG